MANTISNAMRLDVHFDVIVVGAFPTSSARVAEMWLKQVILLDYVIDGNGKAKTTGE